MCKIIDRFQSKQYKPLRGPCRTCPKQRIIMSSTLCLKQRPWLISALKWKFNCTIRENILRTGKISIFHIVEAIKHLSHIGSKYHSNIPCIHFVILFILHYICHQIDCPIKQCSLGVRKQIYKLRALFPWVAKHHLFWSQSIKNPGWEFSKPSLKKQNNSTIIIRKNSRNAQ